MSGAVNVRGKGFDPSAPRAIGKTSLTVSQLGVGCAPFGALGGDNSDTAVSGAFEALYAQGLRYFDVAPFYGVGLAEHRLGACLRSVDRRSLVISTKVGRLLDPNAG